MPLNQEQAQTILDACQSKAEAIGVKLTLVVTDEAGYPVALRRMDGASRVSTEVTPPMAFTAAAFQRPGAELMALQSLPFFRAWSELHGGGLFAGEGTFPLVRDGVLVGVVACGGAREEQDRQAAQAGLEAFEAMS